MRSIDRFYTPSEIADKMVAQVQIKPEYIADFSVGDGALLNACRIRWPKSVFIATDISHKAVSSLRCKEPTWLVGQCDFIKAESRNRCKPLHKVKEKVSLAILNPPFSCRGGNTYAVRINGQDIRCSMALAFVLNSIRYLSHNGQIVTVLPTGCLHSEKDKLAWEVLSMLGQIEIVGTNGYTTFSKCSARTFIMRFSLSASPHLPEQDTTLLRNYVIPGVNNIKIRILRGSIQMHSIRGVSCEQGVTLIHSTELKKNQVDTSRHKVDFQGQEIHGPVVLIHRVGKPSKSKIALYNDSRPIILSDCVIALQCKTVADAKKVLSSLITNWPIVEQAYGGTCARYITIKTLSRLLSSFGFQIVQCKLLQFRNIET